MIPEEQHENLIIAFNMVEQENKRLKKELQECKASQHVEGGYNWEANSEGVWEFTPPPEESETNSTRMWIFQNIEPRVLEPIHYGTQAPREPYPEPGEDNEAFMELYGQINLAVRRMQFGDILWSQHKSKKDTQSETAKLIASLIYNNRQQWQELLK